MEISRPLGRSAAAVLLVVAASALVAIGAPGPGWLLPASGLEGGWARGVRVAGVAAVLAGWIALLVQRGRHGPEGVRRPDPTLPALRSAAAIMGVLVVLALLTRGWGPESAADPGAATGTGEVPTTTEGASPTPPRPSSAGAPTTTTQGSPLLPSAEEVDERPQPLAGDDSPDGAGGAFDWSRLRRVGNVVLLIALLAIVGTAVLALAGRPGGRPREPPPELDAADAEAGLEASLDEIAADGADPGRQIADAYRRLLAALAAAGAPRQPHEAPHEHLHRALGPLGVHPDPLHRLAELYVAAQFSERPMTVRHRAAAAEALEVSLAGLRAMSERSGEGAPAPIDEGAGT